MLGLRRSVAKLAQGLAEMLGEVPHDEGSPPASPPERLRTVPAADDGPYDGAADEMIAKSLYEASKELDPFPQVPPALLNSAHIEDYMLTTAMIFPYISGKRKSASYAMRIGEELAFWDPDKPARTPFIRTLAPREPFELPPNSLVYVQTKELFQLPNYIAVRFNLHIDLVHKGLLLGTGPLVDPGFRGKLMIPLHNMTANTYVLAENDDLIWAEFTKTSMTKEWTGGVEHPGAQPIANFAPFPGDKSDQAMHDYFTRALRPHKARLDQSDYQFPANAIPIAVKRAEDTATRAEDDATAARRDADNASAQAKTLQRWGVGTLLGVGLALVTLIWVTMQMIQSTIGMADGTSEKVQALTSDLVTMRREIAQHDLLWARSTLADYCTISDSDPTDAGKRYRLSSLAAQAEQAARASATSAQLPDPFPTPLVASSNPTPDACRIH